MVTRAPPPLRERMRPGMATHAHVAIDGPAGSGKTTVARALARRLDMLYLDTGAMYRAVALGALNARVDPTDEEAVLAVIAGNPIGVIVDSASDRGFIVFAGARALGDELYGNGVSRIVSIVAAHPAIRRALVERQRAIASDGPVVMAGRDIGTVVLPEAPHKIYLTATVDERVARRLLELAERGVTIGRDELRREIEERDRIDASREVAPLRPAPGALEIDSTGTSVDDVVSRIACLVRPHWGAA